MKLSVCIPVYNVAPYVEQCIRSLFGQTYADIEYVFVDDGTPDDSMAIIRRVLEECPARKDQVKILRHDKNRGLVAARKTAIQACTGELITFCDSDDWVDLDLYAKMVARLEETGADVVLCSTRRYLGARILEIRCPEGLCVNGVEAMRQMVRIPGLNAMMTKVFRRNLIDFAYIELPESIVIAEDYCFTMQVLPRCRLLVGVPDAYYNYRVNANSVTRSRNVRRLVDHHERVYEILSRKVPGDEGVVPRRNLAYMVLFWGVTYGLLSRGDFCLWRDRYVQLGGCWDWSEMSLWGQRIMRLAKRSYALARLLSPFIRRHILDYL